jgi:uncharacterized protein
MSATPTDTLVIVAKYPEPGMVKTRLGVVIGAGRAAALYSAFLRDLAARFDTPDAPWTVRWACAPDARPPEALRAIVGPRAHVFSQRGENFAERLYHTCEDARALGARRLAIMGSDSPQIGTKLIAEAFAALDETRRRSTRRSRAPWPIPLASHDLAISAAEDGGYSLIAFALPDPPDAPPDLFRGITMSTATVLAETEARAAALGLRVARLEPTFDVDEVADLGRLWTALRATPSLAPRSYAALAGLIAAPLQRAEQGRSGNEEIYDDIASRW